MTTQAMTKEQNPFSHIWTNIGQVTGHVLNVIAEGEKLYDQQLSAEREAHKKEIERILSAVARGENLADSLNFDGKSELQKERERAGKLEHALKMCVDALKGLDATDYVAYTAGKVALIEYQKTLNEYDTATNQDHTNPST